MQLYFGLDCGMMEFFTCEQQSKENINININNQDQN
jgi:hypothetical protein